MTEFKAGDIAVKLGGDDAGVLIYVIEVTEQRGLPWVAWGYRKPRPMDKKSMCGSRPDRLRPATEDEIFFWKLGVNSPTKEQFEALDAYVEKQVMSS